VYRRPGDRKSYVQRGEVKRLRESRPKEMGARLSQRTRKMPSLPATAGEASTLHDAESPEKRVAGQKRGAAGVLPEWASVKKVGVEAEGGNTYDGE
jgi:hypothetical protein